MAKIHEYRIVEFEDGYGKQWFRPQRKGWFWWKLAHVFHSPFDCARELVEFETLKEAQQQIGEYVNAEKKAMRDHVMTHTMIPMLAEMIALQIMQDERDKEEAKYRAKSNAIKTLMEELPPKIGTTTDDLVGDPEDVS